MATPAQRARDTLEWWDETGLPRARAAVEADPTNRDLQVELALVEAARERAYTKASDLYDRECEEKYARQGNAWGGDHIFDTMSGGSTIR